MSKISKGKAANDNRAYVRKRVAGSKEKLSNSTDGVIKRECSGNRFEIGTTQI